MGLFKDKDIRLVGIGIVIGAIMPMVYDIIQIIIEKGLVPDVALKMYASIGAMITGIGLLFYFDWTHRKYNH